MIKPIQFSIQLSGMLFLLCSPVMAGTVIEIQNNNELTTLITDGQKVRMNMSEAEYVIVDFSNHDVNLINLQKQQVTFLNMNYMTTGKNAAAVQIQINELGSAQEIAGYKTQKFNYQANGQPCGTIYGSKDAYQANDIKELLAALTTMMEQQRAALGGFASLVDACTLADMQLIDHVKTVGVPMRTEKNGRVELEIKSIKANVSLAENTFVIPASYKILGAKPQMKAVSTAISTDRVKPQQQQPGQQQPGQQAQTRQPGQLPPPAMKAVSTDRVRQQQPGRQQPGQQVQMRQPRQLPPQVRKAASAAISTQRARRQQPGQQAQMQQSRRLPPPPQAWQQTRPAPATMRRYQYPGY